MTRPIFALVFALLAVVGWLVAGWPSAIQRMLLRFYSTRPLLRALAPFSLEVLSTKRIWLFRLTGALIGALFTLMLAGLLIWATDG
jgi:hypothetical protein